MNLSINLSGQPQQNPYLSGMGGSPFGSNGSNAIMQLMFTMMQMMMQMMQMMGGGGLPGGSPMAMAPGQFGSPGGLGGNPMMGGSPLGGFLGGGGSPGSFPNAGGYPGGYAGSQQRGGSSGSYPNSPSGGASGPPTGNLVDLGGGKKVDASIAGNVQAMIQAARRDGVELKINSAHRSRQQQEVLYQKYLNGTGNLAARPGTSNHESGQAIDFANTRGAHAWLARNAGRFGLKNLPGEPWHYSTTGR